ncbi:MAG: hypothetical protein OQL20_12070 [Sedimenticola sp.]|nr:hypothetical protein [Sedimenticola sp.]
MNKYSLLPYVTLLVLLVLLPELALANKFTTIGGGVSGASDEKIRILKQIASYAGVFFILLGAMSLLTRNRFEGFIGMKRKGEKPSPGPYVLIVIGALLSIFFFV